MFNRELLNDKSSKLKIYFNSSIYQYFLAKTKEKFNFFFFSSLLSVSNFCVNKFYLTIANRVETFFFLQVEKLRKTNTNDVSIVVVYGFFLKGIIVTGLTSDAFDFQRKQQAQKNVFDT